MKSTRTTDWIQIITGFAVLLGIGLVVFELRQTRELARADVVAQNFSMATQLDSILLGEQLVKTLAKDCVGKQLSMEDALILNEYFWGQYEKIRMIRMTNLYGGLGIEWEPLAERVLTSIFNMKSGQIWWTNNRSAFATEEQEFGISVLKSLGSANCQESMQPYMTQ